METPGLQVSPTGLRDFRKQFTMIFHKQDQSWMHILYNL